jgi:Lipid A 3-O-deacylase (PagL)
MRKLLVLCFALFCTNLWAQEVTNGSREIEFFGQLGHSVAGGSGDTTIFNAGARWGFGLFDLGRGSFQYELEAIPIYFVRQPIQNAYGVSFTPFDIKYNFRRNAKHAIPFVELGGGVLITTHDVPFGTNAVNFTPQAGVGVHVPFGDNHYHATLALKYVHISNAGLSVPNPGINSIQFRFGIGKFHK